MYRTTRRAARPVQCSDFRFAELERKHLLLRKYMDRVPISPRLAGGGE